MSLKTNIPVSSFRSEGTPAEQALQYPFSHHEQALRQARRELDIVSKIRDQFHEEIGKRLEQGSW